MRTGRIAPNALAQLHALLEQERHRYDVLFLIAQKQRVYADLHRLTSYIDLGVRFKFDEPRKLYWHHVKKTPFVLAYRISASEVQVVLIKYMSALPPKL